MEIFAQAGGKQEHGEKSPLPRCVDGPGDKAKQSGIGSLGSTNVQPKRRSAPPHFAAVKGSEE